MTSGENLRILATLRDESEYLLQAPAQQRYPLDRRLRGRQARISRSLKL